MRSRTVAILLTLLGIMMGALSTLAIVNIVDKVRHEERAECEAAWDVPCWNCGARPDVKPIRIEVLLDNTRSE